MSASGYLFDANVWLALAFDRHPQHTLAHAALARASRRRKAFFCRSTQQSFLRLASNPAILRLARAEHLTNRDAAEMLRRFMGAPAVGWHDEPSGVEELWLRLAERDAASPKVWMDAWLAAFAIQAGMTFVTLDADFLSAQASGLPLELLRAG